MDIFIKADNILKFTNLKLGSDGSYMDSGTITWNLKDTSGDILFSGVMLYVSASNGNWQGTMDKSNTQDLTETTRYFLEITLDDGHGADDFRRISCNARYHEEE